MNLTNLKITDLITPDAKLTFLVGAGCSMDSPSCLPAGRKMMNAIIDYTCAGSEIEKIKNIEQLRFEQLVERVTDHLDNELKIIDYYGECDKPNNQHFFLAEMIKKGHFIITTNFDFLIEYALQQSGVSNNEIIPVITEQDFTKYRDPFEQIGNKKKIILKIHGSTKNVINGESTRKSLRTTIRALGLNKKGLNIFQLEAYKQPLLKEITQNRSLIIMGYSGSDDFDIIPTLKSLKNIENIVWINHFENIEIEVHKVIEINDTPNRILDEEKIIKILKILKELKRAKNAKKVYLININTTSMVKELLGDQKADKINKFSIDLKKYFKENIENPSEFMKYYLSSLIYLDFGMYNEAMFCSEEMVRIIKESVNSNLKNLALSRIAVLNLYREDYTQAKTIFEEILSSDDIRSNSNKKLKLQCLLGLASIKQYAGDSIAALDAFNQAFQIFDELKDLDGKVLTLIRVGAIYTNLKNYDLALDTYESALMITDQSGNLNSKGSVLYHIAKVIYNQEDYETALKYNEKSYKISKELGDLEGQAHCLWLMGSIFNKVKGIDEAIEKLNQASGIFLDLGLIGKMNDVHKEMNKIEDTRKEQKDWKFHLYVPEYPISQEEFEHDRNYERGQIKSFLLQITRKYKQILECAEKIRDLDWKATCLINIGNTYEDQKEYNLAFDSYKESLKIYQDLEILSGIARSLKNIGNLHKNKKKFNNALDFYKKAIDIYSSLSNLEEKAELLIKIGQVYLSKNNQQRAINHYEKALLISQQLGNVYKQAKVYSNMALIYSYNINSIPEFLEYYNRNKAVVDKHHEFNDLVWRFSNEIRKLKSKADNLQQIANSYKNQEKYDLALKRLDESFRLYDQIDNKGGKFLCFNEMGLIYQIQGKIEESLKNYEESLKICKENADLEGVVNNLIHIADLYIDTQESRALILYEKAFQIWYLNFELKYIEDLSREVINNYIKILNSILNIYHNQGKFEEIFNLIDKEFDFFGLSFIGSKKKREYLRFLPVSAQILLWANKIYKTSNELLKINKIKDLLSIIFEEMILIKKIDEFLEEEQILDEYQELIKICNDYKGIYKKSTKKINQARQYEEKEKYSLALKCVEEGIKGFKVLGDQCSVALCFYHLGFINQMQNNYPKAIEYLEKALKIYEKIDLRVFYSHSISRYWGIMRFKSEVLVTLGDIYHEQNEIENALNHYKHSLEVLSKLKRWKQAAKINFICGRIHEEQGDFSKAKGYLNEGLKIYDNLKDFKNKALLIHHLGYCHFKMGDHKKSLKLCGEALKIYKNIEDQEGKSHVYFTLGDIYKTKKDFRNALKYYKESLILAEKVEASEIFVINILIKISEIYKLQDDCDGALDIMKRIIDIMPDYLNVWNDNIWVLEKALETYQEKEHRANSVNIIRKYAEIMRFLKEKNPEVYSKIFEKKYNE